MEKIKIENNVNLFPMSVVLVGALVEDKPNFMAVGWVTRVHLDPPMIAVSLRKIHYTNEGINQKKSFSVNIPGVDLVEKVDYCGLFSGRKADKSQIFEVFYGALATAPMVRECPLCMECKLVQAVDLPNNDLFIGEIVGAYTEERYLTEGKPDILKINPFTLSMPGNKYWSVGRDVGRAWGIGKNFKAGKG